MKKNIFLIVIVFALFGVGCKSGNSPFGCSKGKDRNIDLRLGEPGKTDVQNNLPKNENVKSLESDESINFETDEGQATIIHHSDREIKKDDIVIANSEQQYIVRVKEVLNKKDGSTQVILRQARLNDVIGDEDGSLKIESTPVYDLEDIKKIERLARLQNGENGTIYETDSKGRVVIRNLELFSVDLNNDGNISGGNNKILGIPIKNPYEKFTISSGAGGLYKAVINEAIIEIVPTLRSDSQWKRGKISHLETRIDTKVRYRVDVSYIAAGEIHLEALIDAFMPKKVIPFRVPGPTPVYLDIELGIPAGVSFKASKKGETRIIFESDYEFFTTMNYNYETGISTDKDKKVSIKDTRIETKDSDIKLEAELFLKPQITARLYRVVGPYAYLKPYVRGEIEWPSVEKKDDLFIGVSGGVGIELSEPIFLSSLVSFDSGKLFDFYQSFDLDKRGSDPQAPIKVNQNVQNAVTVNRIGPEGFVRINLKEHKEDFLRYELVKSTQTGLLVPSESFYMDGDLFYYPMPTSQDETFKVRIYGKSGSVEEVEIAINVTPEVINEVSKERYGITTNSYKVSNGTPGEFKGQVPNYDLGGFTARVQSGENIRLGDCLVHRFGYDVQNRELERLSQLACEKYSYLQEDYYRFLNGEETTKSEQERQKEISLEEASLKFTQLKTIDSKEDYARFEFLNLLNFNNFALNLQKDLECKPSIEIKGFHSKTHLGLRFISKGCGDLVQPLDFNTDQIGSAFLRLFKSLKWETISSSKEDGLFIKEIGIQKSQLDEKMGFDTERRFEDAKYINGFSEVEKISILLPLNDRYKNYYVTADPNKILYRSERFLSPLNIFDSPVNYSYKSIDLDLKIIFTNTENEGPLWKLNFTAKPNALFSNWMYPINIYQ